MITIWPWPWWCKVRCDTCRGSGNEACGCDGRNKSCFCSGTQKIKCSICGGSGKI